MSDICDYEGSDYKQRFWTGDRRYEDLVERAALARLLPPTGHAIVDLGAGFGRLADLYAGYERVVLLDYSRSLLRQARDARPHDPRFLYVAADLRSLPLASDAFDAVVTVRVLHHLRRIEPALAEAARILAPGGAFVLEFASKRHLKAIARYLARRQSWSPFSREPIEFAELNLDFHPAHVAQALAGHGLSITDRRAVSLFRWGPLKRLAGPARLARLEALAQPLASLYPLSPSVILRTANAKRPAPRPDHLLACPRCLGALALEPDAAACPACRLAWPCEDAIYDFKSTPSSLTQSRQGAKGEIER